MPPDNDLWDYHAYRDVVPDASPFAEAARNALGNTALACGRCKVPVRWLWHGGRLLPAVVLAAAIKLGRLDEAIEALVIPKGKAYTYLPRACVSLPNELEQTAEVVIRELPCEGGFAVADSIVNRFMEAVVAPGMAGDDWWHWMIFLPSRRIDVGLANPFSYDWQAEANSAIP